MRALHRELVGRRDERQIGELGDLRRRRLGEAGRRIDAGTDRGPAQRELVNVAQRMLDARQVFGQHADIARPFLAQRDRRRVLQMRAADLDDVGPFLGLGVDRVMQRAHRRQQLPRHLDGGGAVHRCREVVVRRLGHVDVIVGMHRLLRAKRRVGELAAAVGDHLVDIHVELRARARHPDMQRKHVVVPASQDLVARLDDQPMALRIEPAAGEVGVGAGLLEQRVGADHLARHQILADREIVQRALGLGAPQLVGGHLDFAHRVGFLAHRHDLGSFPGNAYACPAARLHV